MNRHLCRKAGATAPWMLLASLLPCAAAAQGAGVRLSIELRAESAEAFKAWRRAQGLDPASAEACTTSQSLSEAATRRLLRTYVLDEEGHWQPLGAGDLGPALAAPCASAADGGH